MRMTHPAFLVATRLLDAARVARRSATKQPSRAGAAAPQSRGRVLPYSSQRMST